MRVDTANEKTVIIRLSRRNLLTLLYQLDNSSSWDRGISIRNNGTHLSIVPESDARHYADQNAGWMPYEIEQFTKLFEERLKLYDNGLPEESEPAQDSLFAAGVEAE